MGPLLASLPRRGTLEAVQAGSVFVSRATPYVSTETTAPPPDQVVRTDPTSVLVRGLQRSKLAGDARARRERQKRVREAEAGPSSSAGPGASGGAASSGVAPSSPKHPRRAAGGGGGSGGRTVARGAARAGGSAEPSGTGREASLSGRAGGQAAGPTGSGRGGQPVGGGIRPSSLRSSSRAGPATSPMETSYTREGLLATSNLQLQALLRAWGLPATGPKEELIASILDYQALLNEP